MAGSADTGISKYANEKILVDTLPDDFLRVSGENAMAEGQMQISSVAGFQRPGGILTVTVVQARLAKNYGMTRMDPYCRLRIGVQVFETPTAYNGAKLPRWNKILQSQVPDNLKEIYLEMFDERTFTIDERIAWCMIKIKDDVFSSEEPLDEWYPLNGKQGNDREGMIQIVLQYKKIEGAPLMMGGPMVINPAVPPQFYQPVMYPAPVMMSSVPPMMPMQQPYRQQVPIQNLQQQPAPLNPNDIKLLQEMFPSLEEEIIKTVLHQSGGNVDRAAGALLEMGAS